MNTLSKEVYKKLAVSVLITGLSGLTAQILLLRELLINFQGNELTIGIILANWLISEAIGVFIFGKIIDKLKNKTNAFIMLQIFFSTVLPVSIYLTRTFKYYLGIPVQESIGLPVIFLASLAVVFFPAFSHAGLFSCGCKISSLSTNQSTQAIASIYALETAGTLAGGLLLTYLFLPSLNSFQIAFLLSLLNLPVCLMFLKIHPNKPLKHIILIWVGVVLYLFISQDINKLQHFSIDKQFRTEQVLDYKNSIYGNVALTKNQNQYTVFYNGTPSITLPQGDITLFEEFGQFPLLFHQNPQKILVIGAGAGGLINEILKHPVKKIDYIEPDPLVIATIKKIDSDLIRRELSSSKVKVFNTDAMAFVRNALDKYDVIFIGLSKPVDLSSNRFFASEFFSLVKKRLNPEGIVTFRLPGSLTYISNELKSLNACILNAARRNYSYIRIIPGEDNIFLASDSKKIMGITPGIITGKINEFRIETNLLVPDYLNYRLDPKWVNWFNSSLSNASAKINQNTKPYAVFQMLILWNKQFSRHISSVLNNLGKLSIKQILFLAIIIIPVIYFIFNRCFKLRTLNIAYSIFTTGFFGMLINLILIFRFQISYGYLYHAIGALMSLFMAGASIGSIIAISFNNKSPLSLFIKLETITIIFSLTTAIITFVYSRLPYSVFFLLFLIAGMLVGSQFSLASKICLSNNKQIGETAGLLYFSDLMGGCIAGITGGVLFVPILGLFNTCVVIILLKLTSLLVFFTA